MLYKFRVFTAIKHSPYTYIQVKTTVTQFGYLYQLAYHSFDSFMSQPPNMPSNSPWIVEPEQTPSHSLFGSIRKLGRKSSNASAKSAKSTKSNHSTHSQEPPTQRARGAADLNPSTAENMGARSRSVSPNPFSNTAPATRRPDRPGMNAFTTPSNEPPPAYTASPTVANNAPLFDVSTSTTTTACTFIFS